jgi:O-antigen/teichoic acid export membrane protein
MFSIKFIKNNRNLFYYGLVEAIAKGLNILIVILLASFSNLDVYAQIALLIASELIFIELILAGQHNTALRFIQKNKSNVDEIIIQCSRNVFFIATIIFTIFSFLPSEIFLLIVETDLKLEYLILLLGSFFMAMIHLNLFRLRKEDKLVQYASIRIVLQVLKFVLCIVFVNIFGNSISYPIAVLGASSIALLYGGIRWNIFSYIKKIFHYKYDYKYLLFGLPLMTHGLAGLLYTQLDRFMLNSLSTAQDLAIYHFNITIGMIPFFLINVAALYYTPKIYSSENYDYNAKKYLRNFLSISLLGSFLVSLLVIFLLYPIILMFVPLEYSEGSIILYGGSLLIILSCLSNFALFKATSLKKVNLIPVVTIASLTLSFFLNYELIPAYGRIGALCSTLSAEIFFIISTLLLLKRYE